jgi:5'-nucleotidase
LKEKFDLVLSGINKGVNLGGDIVYSGTVGAVFEAARLGVKAIAFSSFPDDQEGAAKYFDEVYEYIVNNGMFAENGIFNVNIPQEVKGIRMTYQGSPYFADAFELMEGSEEIYVQVGAPIPDEYPEDLDRDTVAILHGYITVTPLLATRTNMETFHKFKKLN